MWSKKQQRVLKSQENAQKTLYIYRDMYMYIYIYIHSIKYTAPHPNSSKETPKGMGLVNVGMRHIVWPAIH